jgi:hypothetical protein
MAVLFGAIVTRADAQAIQKRLLPGLVSTDQSVVACTALDGATRQAWRGWYLEAFWFVTTPISFTDDINALIDRGKGYEKELYDWQSRLLATGCTLSAPRYEPPKELETPLEKYAKWGLTLAGIGLGAYVVSVAAPVAVEALSLVKRATPEKKAAERRRRRR